MKIVKTLAVLAVVYVGIVVTFESLIGILQPAPEGTLVIATRDEAGNASDRVLARLESGGQLYVAANHWPRAWYEQALANPAVEVTIGEDRSAYRAVPVDAAEHARVDADNALGIGFRFVTGFPPRRILRLDPR